MRHCTIAALILACACSHETPSSAGIEQVEEPAGWPLEKGDTIDFQTRRELSAQFESVRKWGLESPETILELRGPEVRASDHGLAAFDFTFVKVQDDKRRPLKLACPPPGLVVEPGDDFFTTDGALILEPEAWPPGLPCDHNARYRPALVYRGHVK